MCRRWANTAPSARRCVISSTLVRQAGRDIGAVLAVVVNFFHPEAVILRGALSGAEPLVAALRGVLYERCLPMATGELIIRAAACGPDAGLLGAGHAALRELPPPSTEGEPPWPARPSCPRPPHAACGSASAVWPSNPASSARTAPPMTTSA
ncbi:ROK family protein [Streptomyces sp. NPDC048483]|uniref:ROK family protein n=1 Tax=Streptomyces sp. NPDC048483 TaxID=3154927 RepID=UPI0034452C99